MNKKLTYEQPSCDLFEVKVEEGFLAGSFDSTNGTEKFTNKYDDEDL